MSTQLVSFSVFIICVERTCLGIISLEFERCSWGGGEEWRHEFSWPSLVGALFFSTRVATLARVFAFARQFLLLSSSWVRNRTYFCKIYQPIKNKYNKNYCLLSKLDILLTLLFELSYRESKWRFNDCFISKAIHHSSSLLTALST